MKKQYLLLALLLGSLVSVKAQTNTNSATASQTQGNGASAQSTPLHHHENKAWANLSDMERQQLKAAMKQIKHDPQLVAARQSLKDSQTKEAKVAAHQALNQARHDLLLKADPTIQPILDKIGAAKKNPTEQ